MDYSSILSKPKSFFGKQKVWMARGEDLALFNTHRPNIQNLLRHSCIPESSHNLWIGLYRVGTTEEEAKTFVVVSCTDRRIRKLTRDILSSCPIFQPGEALDRFKVISKATLPETACEPQQTMQDEDNKPSETSLLEDRKGINMAMPKPQTTICLYPSHTGDNYLCRKIQVFKKGQSLSRTATAGPLILLNGCTYQLTVAHVVDSVDSEKDVGHDTAESTVDDWDDWDDEEDDDTSRCSVDEDVASWNISVRRNRTPDTYNDESTDEDNSEHLSSDSVPKLATQKDKSTVATNQETTTNEEPTDDPVRLFTSPFSSPPEQPVLEDFIVTQYFPSDITIQSSIESCQVSSEMDYLLIPTKDGPPTLAYDSGKAELVQVSEAFDLQEQTKPRPILIATGLFGYVEGVVFPAPSLLRSRGSKEFQTLYCVECNSAITNGTSGSAVFDKETGLLAGHLVLGCPEKNISYMVPIVSVLSDLEVRCGQKGNCQVQINVSAAVRLNVVDMVTAGFRELTQSSLLGGPTIQHDQESPEQAVSKSPKTTQWERINKPIISILKGLQRDYTVRLDPWDNRFGQKPRSSDIDRLLFARFEDIERAFLEAMALILVHPQPAFEDHQDIGIPQTRDNSLATIGSSATIKSCNHNGKDGPQPTAWMVDIFKPLISKEKALDRREVFALLEGKNLPSHDPDNEDYTPRCLYIKNPDPEGIMAFYKASSRFRIERFQELFFSYITKQPDPRINLTSDNWLGGAYFSIEVNLPFLVITSRAELDKRAGARNPGVRRGYSLSFLNQEQPRGFQDQNTGSWADGSYLYPGVCSVIVVGRSDRYWTAACLDDGLTDDTAIFDTTSDGHSEDTMKSISPRAYALELLARMLEKVAGYHRQAQLALENGLITFEKNTSEAARHGRPIQQQFSKGDFSRVLRHIFYYNSRVLEKLDTFLSKDLSSSPDGPPGNPLWAGFYLDPGSSKSLPRIQKSFLVLRDTQSHLEILEGRVQELIMKQKRPVTDNYSTPWLTLAAYLVAIIALIYGINKS